MGGLITVCLKEIVDNFHDRRTLLWSLLFGPLFGPVLFAVMVGIVIDRTLDSAEEQLQLPVLGSEHAPNLAAFLEAHRIDIVAAPADPEQAVRDGDEDLVLAITPAFGERFIAGQPAPVQLYVDQSDSHAAATIARVRGLLQAYGARIGAMRLQSRGINPIAAQAVLVETVDVSTPTGRSVVLLGMMTYFILFSMLIGGMYLAIDATAGERERGSLEALLTAPVTRTSLILGKIAATCFYMLVSLTITVGVFTLMLQFVPLERLGMNTEFTVGSAFATIGVMAPFILVGAGMMTVIASFTRSYKEAQTWISAVLFIPTLPILFAAIQSLRPSLQLMAVPSLSQHLLVTEIIKNTPIDAGWVAISVISTALFGAALIYAATLLYKREALLG
ncbi:MAG: ABC transporter permease [Gammaproteobacteria bacterium]|nr:ABC transporter permease [Gammaproteobacteria bacterium]NND60509.1 ABC transporter permease [Gammaproteobacteria bacterium]